MISPPSTVVVEEEEEGEFEEENQTLTLIPGLPDDIAALILAILPYSHHSRLKSICKSWRIFFSSKTLIPIRRKHLEPSRLSHLVCIFPHDPQISSPYIFDPQNLAWSHLPPMPCNPFVYGLCNFTSVSHNSHLYVLGGSLFDTRSFPLDRPISSSSAFRFDFASNSWDSLPPMLSARGSFACAAVPNSDRILVAGGGSRHNMFGAAGSRMGSAEMYDIRRNEWVALDGMPRFRAGCVGFLVGGGDEREFWVMGGYGESRTVLGVFPVDEYYRDAVVMKVKSGGGIGKWRELGDMWEEGERRRLGKIAIVEDGRTEDPDIFMLDDNNSEIYRYKRTSNRWLKETAVPRIPAEDTSVGFVAVNGELFMMCLLSGMDSKEIQKLRPYKRSGTLFIQIYHPLTKTWRTLTVKPPFHSSLDFKSTVMCTIRL